MAEATRTRSLHSPLGLTCLLLVGLGAGLSPFFYAYYDASIWTPIGLGLVGAGALAFAARPMRLAAPAALALVGLLGLGAWSLVSAAWAESVEGAVVSGNRWLAYGALLLLLLVLVRDERRAALLLLAVGAGVIAVALSVLARLLGGDPGALFLNGRLNAPLGYINGEGCLLAMGVWLCMAAAESRRAELAGPAAGMAAMMACLALLTQSRGTALGTLLPLIVVVTLVPGRTRRTYGLLVVGAGVVLAAPSLLHVYDSAVVGRVSAQAAHAAGRAVVLAGLGVGTLWTALTAWWEMICSRSLRAVGSRTATARLARVRAAGSRLLAIPALAALVIALASTHAIEHEARAQWRAFTHLAVPAPIAPQHHTAKPTHARVSPTRDSTSESHSRLLSGAGNRYDYWRIAWRLWSEHPFLGVGAGGYTRFYYQRRATTEDVEQPHSVELQALSELGLAGALLLACFLVAVAWGALRMRQAARVSRRPRSVLIAACGSFVAWLTQASVDWMHLLPGLTAIAIAAGAAVLYPPRALSERRVRRRRPDPDRGPLRVKSGKSTQPAGVTAVLIVMVLAGASLSRQVLSQRYAQRAQRELATRPAAALSDAQRSLDIDPDAVQTYYVKAAALARFDRASAAEATLHQALRQEPNDFVTWALLGDLAMREAQLGAAKRDYSHAHVLNPRNVALATLAANPPRAQL